MDTTLVRIATAEGLIAALAGIGLEVHAMRLLCREGRLIHYYHFFPLATCTLLMMCSLRPLDASLNVVASQSVAILTANMHNTYFVHVVAMRDGLQTPRAQDLFVDLFAPKHVADFYPWGVVREVAYSAVCFAHMVFRTYYAVVLVIHTCQTDGLVST